MYSPFTTAFDVSFLGSSDQHADCNHIDGSPQQEVILTFRNAASTNSAQAYVARKTYPIQYAYVREIAKQIETESNMVALDPSCLLSLYEFLLPKANCICDHTLLFQAVTVAINISNITSAQTKIGAFKPNIPLLIPPNQISQIVVDSANGTLNCNRKGIEVPLSTALQALATMIPCTIFVLGDIEEIISSTIGSAAGSSVSCGSVLESTRLPFAFEPQQKLNDSEPSQSPYFLLLEQKPLHLFFSAVTGKFLVLISKDQQSSYLRITRLMNLKRNSFHLRDCSRASKRRLGDSIIGSSGANEKSSLMKRLMDSCFVLHKILREQHTDVLIPAFNQHGILRMLVQRASEQQTQAPVSLVMELGLLSIQAMPDCLALNRALGIIYGLQYFDPAAANIFLCLASVFLTNWNLSEGSSGFILSSSKLCSDSEASLRSIGPRNSSGLPSVMPTAIAAAALLATIMPEGPASACWRSLNSGLFAKAPEGVKSVGSAIISLLAYSRSEQVLPNLGNAKTFLSDFFLQLKSEEEGVILLKNLFLQGNTCGGIKSRGCAFMKTGQALQHQSFDPFLLALRLVCSCQEPSQCLAKVIHGTPSTSIIGVVIGVLIGYAGLSKTCDPPVIHSHQENQLRAIASVVMSCYEVCTNHIECSVMYSVSLIQAVWYAIHMNFCQCCVFVCI